LKNEGYAGLILQSDLVKIQGNDSSENVRFVSSAFGHYKLKLTLTYRGVVARGIDIGNSIV
jgi:hypothetical protein